MRLNFGPLTDATTRNWGMPGLGGTMLAAGQILPMMQKRREDQTKGRFQELLTALDQTKVMPQTPDEPLVDPKHAGILMIGELLSRLSGGEGVVNPYMQGRGMMLGQLGRQRAQEEQARAQNAAIGLQKAQLLLSEAQREQEGFESRVNRAQTLEFGRQKQKFEQEKEANEFAFKMAQYGDASANILNDNLMSKAGLFNNAVNARWNAGGQFSPQELDELNSQRDSLIASGVPSNVLAPIPAGPTRAKEEALVQQKQWDKEFSAKERDRKADNEREDKKVAITWEKFKADRSGEKLGKDDATKLKQRWFSEMDKKLERVKEDYAVATQMLEIAPEDQKQKAQGELKAVVARFRHLRREKDKQLGVKRTQLYYSSILPDETQEGIGGVIDQALRPVNPMVGDIGGSPIRTAPIARPAPAPAQKPKPKPKPAKGNLRQVDDKTFVWTDK